MAAVRDKVKARSKVKLPKGMKLKPSVQVGGSIASIKDSMRGGNDRFLKLADDGDTVNVIFLQEPQEWVRFQQHSLGQGEGFRSVACLGTGCPLCVDGNQPRFRAAINVYVTEEKVIKILFVSGESFSSLLSKFEKRQTLRDRVYSITREGIGLATKYHFEREDQKVSEKVLNKVIGQGLLDVTEDLKRDIERFYGEDKDVNVADFDDDDDEFDEDEDIMGDEDEDDEEDDDEDEDEEFDEDDEDEDEEDDDEILPKKKSKKRG